MYRRATTGLEENNNKFSNCSMEKMGPVVISVKNQLLGKVNCLTGFTEKKKKETLNKIYLNRMFTNWILWKSKC
jgi:hypothetical protein